MPVKVKICGITNIEDALAASEAGADFLGFIFYPPGKRSITPEQAASVAAELRRLSNCPILVGVFVDEEPALVAQVLDDCRLDLAQLSGGEPPGFVGDPASPLYGRSYKVLKPATLAEAESNAEWFLPPEPRPGAPTLLLDAYHPTLPGGTGRKVDWAIAAHLAQQIPGLMLAGGLTPANVAAAARQVRPFAVDVASGVEREPGRKDYEKVRAFVRSARGG